MVRCLQIEIFVIIECIYAPNDTNIYTMHDYNKDRPVNMCNRITIVV